MMGICPAMKGLDNVAFVLWIDSSVKRLCNHALMVEEVSDFLCVLACSGIDDDSPPGHR